MEFHAIGTVASREAARLLGVGVATLAAWEQQYGFPRTLTAPGERRRFSLPEVLALRTALRREVSVTLAVRQAQRALEAPPRRSLCFGRPVGEVARLRRAGAGRSTRDGFPN